MSLSIHPLTTHIGAQVLDVDLTGSLDDATVEAIREALDLHCVLVFPGQRFDDSSQIAFSARFGELERTVYKAEGDGGVPIANITNVDYRTDELFPPGHARIKSNAGNEMWHTDSSFKPVPAYCSMLSAREVPPCGGDTQFATCRAAYAALSRAHKDELEGLVAEHSYAHSRSFMGDYVPPKQTLNEVPPVQHAVLRANPRTGAPNFYTGSHASHVIGWPVEKGRQLLRDLVERATAPEFVYIHKWQPFDFVIWDNRCVLHRGMPFDTEKHRRVMRRTTLAGAGSTLDEAKVGVEAVLA
ncbi:MAG: alpha-ketoglutarate-dependent 2,4-dichlorophenoxyacetate dioxygenase [Gammaproteobacteria bacterium]|jgi:alpha-ketoglutarate-dependent 2,4-dichlorophenoxyacetate dioxygenase